MWARAYTSRTGNSSGSTRFALRTIPNEFLYEPSHELIPNFELFLQSYFKLCVYISLKSCLGNGSNTVIKFTKCTLQLNPITKRHLLWSYIHIYHFKEILSLEAWYIVKQKPHSHFYNNGQFVVQSL